MTIVVDASFVVAALLEREPTRGWARSSLLAEQLIAPHHMPVETANILRREVIARRISPEAADAAHAYLLSLPAILYPHEPFAARIWQLRPNVTPYDAWYVALAEAEGVDLATLDRRLAAAPGVRCGFLLPPM